MPQAGVAQSAALDQLCVNTVRTLSMDAVQRANSGHPGAPMALAPLCYVLWTRHLRHNPANPAWQDRDRFVLSAGHASMLLYSLLHLTGYEVSLDDIKNFRQLGSTTPGHPEHGHTPGVETTTGPLGQGVANAVGMALAEAHLARRFNRPEHGVVDHRVYFVASDGDMMEGVSHEAASLAGHLGLGKLIGYYDDNRITIDGSTDLAYSDDAARRFEAYGWHVQLVDDGNDLGAIDAATEAAKAESERPSLIIVRTHIAFGSPNKQDTAAAHGAPLGEEEVALTKQNLGWPASEPFTVPQDALAQWRACKERGAEQEVAWDQAFQRYAAAHPELAAELQRRWAGDLQQGWEAAIPRFSAADGALATRAASGKVLNAVADVVPELLGGSADLGPSNNTIIKGAPDLGPGALDGRNMYFGVREHGMGAVMNGMALHGGFIPYGGTFLVFSDYMRPTIRLAAMMGLRVVYVFTHDSIGLGEDGPTHQPVEMLATLRAIPNLVVIRPGDATETAEAWRIALERRDGPVALVLTRQKVPTLDRDSLAPAAGVQRGGYVLADADDTAVILIATGSELSLALEARQQLSEHGVTARVVSMPSQELFAAQPAAYRDQVLPPGVTARLAVEAAHPMAWYRWVGSRGDVIGIERFGASAPHQQLFEVYGFTVDAVVARARALLEG
jgi:transketolase